MGRYSQSEIRGRQADKEGNVGGVNKWLCAVVLCCAAPATVASAQTFAALANFNLTNGSNPSAPLVQGSDGNLYGATRLGGSAGLGTIFRLTKSGALTTLASFTGTNGTNPNGGLIQASDGNFYGTTLNGGASNNGTVFRVTPAGALTTIYSFNGTDGANPFSGVIQATDGSFYGTAQYGGGHSHGAVFKVTAGGAYTLLYSFNVTDGDLPRGTLVQASDGNFYGTAFAGGAHTKGTVFKITSAGALTTLYDFDVSGAPVNIPDGANPNGSLIQGRDGALYGTTVSSGGTNNYGTVFKITTSGAFTNLHSFLGDGSSPNPGLVVGPEGNFYGTTLTGGTTDFGTIFRISLNGDFASVYSFQNADGNTPIGGLVLGSDGNLYGTASRGGRFGYGMAFAFTPAPPPGPTPSLPPPPAGPPSLTPRGVAPVFSSTNAITPGEWISIYGTSLASSISTWSGNFPTTLAGVSVTINGRSAFLSYVSATQIDVQAPDDPARGVVQVAVETPAGVSTTSVSLESYAPSFSLLDTKHVAGIILRPNGGGAFGGGAYDIIGPTGTSLGYRTVAARAGDTVELFGVGFGPTNPAVTAGQAFAGSAPTTTPVQILINNISVTPTFAGITSAGLYQINLTIPPGAGTGDVSLRGVVSSVRTPLGPVISLQ